EREIALENREREARERRAAEERRHVDGRGRLHLDLAEDGAGRAERRDARARHARPVRGVRVRESAHRFVELDRQPLAGLEEEVERAGGAEIGRASCRERGGGAGGGGGVERKEQESG